MHHVVLFLKKQTTWQQATTVRRKESQPLKHCLSVYVQQCVQQCVQQWNVPAGNTTQTQHGIARKIGQNKERLVKLTHASANATAPKQQPLVVVVVEFKGRCRSSTPNNLHSLNLCPAFFTFHTTTLHKPNQISTTKPRTSEYHSHTSATSQDQVKCFSTTTTQYCIPPFTPSRNKPQQIP